MVFLQQLGRGLRRTAGKDALVVIDFIGNHRSFLLKPRTLLGATTGMRPSNAAVISAMRSGQFELPAGCSATFDVEAVDVLARLARIGHVAQLEEFCRSYAAEEGIRPTAMQAWRAGHNPAAARSAHGGWFGLLDHLGLLGDDEVAAWQTNRDVLTGFEVEPVTKSYKLVTLKALLSDGTLRSGAGITELVMDVASPGAAPIPAWSPTPARTRLCLTPPQPTKRAGASTGAVGRSLPGRASYAANPAVGSASTGSGSCRPSWSRIATPTRSTRWSAEMVD